MRLSSALKTTTALVSASVAISLALPAPSALAQEFDDRQALEEVIVTGSFIRRKSQFDSPSPISVLGSEDLAQIGASTIRDITQTLTINAGAQNNPDAFTQNLTTGTENINLRGLGVQSTLVLLNSRRQVASAAPTDGGLLFVDTASLVPLIAVDRVEILKDGASALYGTDAVAGVVNFITRDDFEGMELEFDFQTVAADGDATDYRISGIWGGGNDRGHVTASFSYFDRSQLTTRERDLRRGGEGPPDFLSVSTLTSFPANFLVPSLAGLDTDTAAAVAGNFDQNTAFFSFAELGGALQPLPVIENPFSPGSFLVGAFDSFQPNAGGPGTDPLGLTDGLTASSLPGVLAALGTDTSQLSPLQQQALAQALLGVQQAVSAEQQAALIAGTATPFALPVLPDPGCEAVPEDDAFLAPGQPATAGSPAISPLGQCVYDFGPFFSVIPEESRLQGFAQARYDITDTIEFYGEFGFARNRAERETSNFPLTSPPTIAATNPFNPFGTSVVFAGRSIGPGQVTDPFTDSPNPNRFEYDTYRVQAGLRGDITDNWFFDISYLRGINRWDLFSSDNIASNFALALAGLGGNDCDVVNGTPGVGGCQFYNPFASGFTDTDQTIPLLDGTGTPVIDPATGLAATIPVRNSEEILDFLVGDITIDGESDLTVVDAVVTGDTFTLPAGPVGLALGVQFRSERLAHDLGDLTNDGDFTFVSEPTNDFDASRDVYAAFAEVNIPVIQDLEINAAVRFEDTEGVESTVDPKVSLIYRPFTSVEGMLSTLTVRGSWGTSFRAPSLFQSFGNQTTLNSVIDPLTGQAPFIPITSAGSEDLSPEESRTFNVGVSLEPLAGLEISADYWNFEFEDVITEFDPQQLVNLAAQELALGLPAGSLLPENTQVIRNPSGTLAAVNTVFTNLAFIETHGFDFSAFYTYETANFGTFRVGGEGTYVLSYDIPLEQPDGTTVRFDAADFRNDQNFADPIPDFRFNATVNWLLGGHSAALFVRYIGSFTDDENCAGPVPGSTAQLAAAAAILNDPTLLCQDFAQIDSHTTVDLQYSYRFGGIGPVQDAAITLGVINLFDAEPPFVDTDGGFETRTHDPRGRLVYARLKVGF